jgi:hypothetical protein
MCCRFAEGDALGLQAVPNLRPLSSILLVACALTPACTKTGAATDDAPVAECAKAEQRCQYADGKIGLCTPNAIGCDGGGQCLVCMSLH